MSTCISQACSGRFDRDDGRLRSNSIRVSRTAFVICELSSIFIKLNTSLIALTSPTHGKQKYPLCTVP